MEQTVAANCPVSGIKVNETVVRLIAFCVAVLSCIAAIYHLELLCFFLTIDFSTRAFGSGKYSLLRRFAILLSISLRLKNKPVDVAPKKFAAGMGAVFCFVSGILQYFQFYTSANVVIVLLVFCALLESLLAFCMGCVVYGWIRKIN